MVTPRKPVPPTRARKTALGAVARAVSTGSGLETVALELARRLDDPNVETKDVAGLARELRMVLAAITDAGGSVQGDASDDLAARRKARRSAAGFADS